MSRARFPRVAVVCLLAWFFAGHWTGIVHAAVMSLSAPTGEQGHGPTADQAPGAGERCHDHRVDTAGAESTDENDRPAVCVEKCATLANGVVHATHQVPETSPANAWHRILFNSPPTVAPTPPIRPPRA